MSYLSHCRGVCETRERRSLFIHNGGDRLPVLMKSVRLETLFTIVRTQANVKDQLSQTVQASHGFTCTAFPRVLKHRVQNASNRLSHRDSEGRLLKYRPLKYPSSNTQSSSYSL